MDFEKDIALIKNALENGLSHIKPNPRIYIEVNELKYGLNVWMISKGFSGIQLHKRHELVWRILEQEVDKATRVKISLLFILTPKELGGEIPWEENFEKAASGY
jgi:stress-induced morphogen